MNPDHAEAILGREAFSPSDASRTFARRGGRGFEWLKVAGRVSPSDNRGWENVLVSPDRLSRLISTPTTATENSSRLLCAENGTPEPDASLRRDLSVDYT